MKVPRVLFMLSAYRSKIPRGDGMETGFHCREACLERGEGIFSCWLASIGLVGFGKVGIL